jgi:amino acid adenylation domain-containing protein
VEFKKEEVEQSIPDRFEEIAARFSDRIAVKTRNVTLTYDALNKRANQIASAILLRQTSVQKPIGLLLENDAPMICAFIGALKAGRMYVPLDPSLPYKRNSYIVSDSQAEIVVTDDINLSLAKELFGHSSPIVNIDAIDSSVSNDNARLPLTPESLAYILYTSGSTGQPKGVVHNHRNVLHYVLRHTNSVHLSPDDRQTLLYSYSVNGAARDIFSALLNGASLFSLDIKTEGVDCLTDWLLQHEITTYCSVATVFRHFVGTLKDGSHFPKLRLIKLGGEPVYQKDVELYKKYFSEDCVFCSGLGATETGTTATSYFIDKKSEISGNTLSLGFAAQDTEILLLDEAGKEVEPGEIGEIAVRSRYLFKEYWRRPDLTRLALLPDAQADGTRVYLTGDMGCIDPESGLKHVGRKDFQIKVRGHRIEAAEVELALSRIDGIRESVVTACDDHHGDKQLVAYIVPAGAERIPNLRKIRAVLVDSLPDFMIPATFVLLEALPVAPNGKIDRQALPAPKHGRSDLLDVFTVPRNATEKMLSEMWSQMFGIDVGIHDNFFELGGNSLLASHLIATLRDVYFVELKITDIFEAPTIAELTQALMTNESAPGKIEKISCLMQQVKATLATM